MMKQTVILNTEQKVPHARQDTNGLKSTRNKCEDQVFPPFLPVELRKQSTVSVTQGIRLHTDRGKGTGAHSAVRSCEHGARGKRHRKLLSIGRGGKHGERHGKAVWAHDVGTAFKEAGGPGEVARLLSGGLPDFFT